MMATRPGPLRDIELHEGRTEIRSDGVSWATTRTVCKRPFSPSSHSPSSPTKRRLVRFEGRAKTLGGVCTPHKPRPQANLYGQHSPARKLDFGFASSPGSVFGDENVIFESERVQPQRCGSSRQLSNCVGLLPSLYDSSQCTPSSPKPLLMQYIWAPSIRSDCMSEDMEMSDHFQSTTHTLSSLARCQTITRKVRLPDPSSEHYPGFIVYQDSCDYVYDPSTTSTSSTSMSRMDKEHKKDLDKENIPPEKLPEIYIGEAAWAKAGFDCPSDVEMASPGKSSQVDIHSVQLDMCYAQRKIRDIGNIRENDSGGRRAVNLALTAPAFLFLDEESEDQEPVKS